MLCSLSGVAPQEPVLLPRSGAVFERKLIESYVATAGKDPLTEEPMEVSDLIAIRQSVPVHVPPRPPTASLIPAMLQDFQKEWDALALEVFALRKQLHLTRLELSTALYRYDAAVRVAARAQLERDDAQRALAELAEAVGLAGENGREETTENKPESGENGAEAGENGSAGDLATAVDELQRAREALFALHKKTKLSLPVTALTTVEAAKSETDLSWDGVQTRYVELGEEIYTGLFGTAVRGDVVAECTAVAMLHDDQAPEAEQNTPIGARETGVEALAGAAWLLELPGTHLVVAHPTRPYFVAVSGPKWTLALPKAVLCTHKLAHPISAAAVHVDGTLVALAAGETVAIVDLATQQQALALAVAGHVTSMAFGGNGYWLFVLSTELHVYDLRKGSAVHSLGPAVHFAVDPACQLAATVHDGLLTVHLYAKKSRKWLAAYTDPCGALHSLSIEGTTVTGIRDLQKVTYSLDLVEPQGP